MKQRVTSIEITLDLKIKGDFYWLSSEEKRNYSEGGQKIKKPCPAYFSNDYIENLILNWREN